MEPPPDSYDYKAHWVDTYDRADREAMAEFGRRFYAGRNIGHPPEETDITPADIPEFLALAAKLGWEEHREHVQRALAAIRHEEWGDTMFYNPFWYLAWSDCRRPRCGPSRCAGPCRCYPDGVHLRPQPVTA